jgi:hypothetical protein
VGGERRGARGRSSVDRGTVNSYVGERDRGPNWGARDGDCRPGKLGKINVRLRNASAAHTDTDRVSTRLARVGLPGRMVLTCESVMIPISYCWMIVRGRPVVVIWVIVPEVFVDVQRRGHGRRHGQSLNKHDCDESAHEDSLLRPAPPLLNGERLGLG